MVYQGQTTTLQKFAESISAWEDREGRSRRKKFRVLSIKASLIRCVWTIETYFRDAKQHLVKRGFEGAGD
jgi:hypothetical protein